MEELRDANTRRNTVTAKKHVPNFLHQTRRVLGVFQQSLTLILLQKYRDTKGSHIVIQIGGAHAIGIEMGKKHRGQESI